MGPLGAVVNGPSEHLSWAELACHDGTPYPPAFIADGRVDRLATVFETIRAACGGVPLTVLSAYRSPAYNATVEGSALRSQHVEGRALDLRPPAGMTVKAFHAVILGLSRDCLDIGGIGRYRTFVHVDIRPRVAGRIATWRPSGGPATA